MGTHAFVKDFINPDRGWSFTTEDTEDHWGKTSSRLQALHLPIHGVALMDHLVERN